MKDVASNRRQTTNYISFSYFHIFHELPKETHVFLNVFHENAHAVYIFQCSVKMCVNSGGNVHVLEYNVNTADYDAADHVLLLTLPDLRLNAQQRV